MEPSPYWRPVQFIRPLVIGVLRRDEMFLMTEVLDDSGTLTGWRPLGGGIEFGESAKCALRREFVEEIGCEIESYQLISVLENIYTHEGEKGHEIVFAYLVKLPDGATPPNDRCEIVEGPVSVVAKWISLDEMLGSTGEIYPAGLADHLVMISE